MKRGKGIWGLRGMGAVLLSLICGAAAAQIEAPSIISEGKADVEVVPDYAEFRLDFKASANTFPEALANAAPFDKRVRELLKTRELEPSAVDIGGPVFLSSSASSTKRILCTVRMRGLIRFDMRTLGGEGDDASTDFAAICEQIRTLGQALRCEVSGPSFGVHEPAPVAQAAVGKAVEGAYPAAEGAAKILQGNIVAVQRVEVVDVVWNGGDSAAENAPSLDSITCTARVRVEYLYESVL